MFNKKKNQNMVSTELNLVNIKCNQYNYLKKILFDEKMNLIIQNLQHLDVDLDSFNDFISIDNLEQLLCYNLDNLMKFRRFKLFDRIRSKHYKNKIKVIIEKQEFKVTVKCDFFSKKEISFIVINCKYSNNEIKILDYIIDEEFIESVKEQLIENNVYYITEFSKLQVKLLEQRDSNIVNLVGKVQKFLKDFFKFDILNENIEIKNIKMELVFNGFNLKKNFISKKTDIMINRLLYLKHEKSFVLIVFLILFVFFDKRVLNISLLNLYGLYGDYVKKIISFFVALIGSFFVVSNYNIFSKNLRILIKNILFNCSFILLVSLGIEEFVFKSLNLEDITILFIFYIMGLLFSFFIFCVNHREPVIKKIINTLKKDDPFSRYYYCIILSLIIVCFIYLFTLIDVDTNEGNILRDVLMVIFFICSFYIGFNFFKKSYNNISIEFLNLDYDDIIQSKIYYSNYFFSFYDSRIFKINMENFFPENAIDCEVFVLNQFHTVLSTNRDRKKKYFYFSLHKHFINIKNNVIENHKIKVLVSYKVNGKVYRKKAIIYIDVNNKYDEIFISKYSVEQCYRVLFPIKELRKNVEVKNIFSLLGNSYLYNLKNIDISAELNSPIKLESKWLYHDGEYGNGKTTYDRILCMNHNYTPVRISPWEANYDEDFLYLMYMKALQYSKMKSYMNHKSALIIVFIIIGAVSSFLISYIDYIGSIIYVIFRYLNIGFEIDKSIFDTIIMNIFELANDYSIDVLTILEVFLFTIIIWIFVCKYLYQIIINQKDSSKFHQDYYIYHLLKMVRKNQLMLVIEDIDRMSSDAYQNVLRVCSCVNSNYRFTRPLGIISLSSEEIIKKENLEGRDGNQIYNDLKNKIFINEIADKFNEKQSIVLFLQSICFATYKLLLLSDKDDEYRLRLLKEIITYYFPNNFKANFRDTKYFLQKVLNIENIMKKEEYENLKVKLKELFMEDVRF